MLETFGGVVVPGELELHLNLLSVHFLGVGDTFGEMLVIILLILLTSVSI